MIDFGVAFDKLASMESADDIAEYFKYEGITGYPSSHMSCPIATWMEQQTGVRISAASFIVDIDHINNTVESTEAMKQFMYQFDSGYYPDLVTQIGKH